MYFFKPLLALGLVALGTSTQVSNSTLDGRIIRGEYVTDANFGAPWFCGIFRVTEHNEHEYACGATLIAEQTVLTAAQCFKDGENYVARCGTNSLLGGPYPAIPIDTFRRHPSYGQNAGDTISYNIALGYFKDPIECSDRVQFIEIQTDFLADSDVDLQVYGFGRDNQPTGSNGDNEPTFALKSIETTRYVHDSCQTFFKTILYFPEMPPGTFCAISKDPIGQNCQLDIGGPIILKSTQRQVGVLSYISPHCTLNQPGAYSMLKFFAPWVSDWVRPFQTFSPQTPGF